MGGRRSLSSAGCSITRRKKCSHDRRHNTNEPMNHKLSFANTAGSRNSAGEPPESVWASGLDSSARQPTGNGPRMGTRPPTAVGGIRELSPPGTVVAMKSMCKYGCEPCAFDGLGSHLPSLAALDVNTGQFTVGSSRRVESISRCAATTIERSARHRVSGRHRQHAVAVGGAVPALNPWIRRTNDWVKQVGGDPHLLGGNGVGLE